MQAPRKRFRGPNASRSRPGHLSHERQPRPLRALTALLRATAPHGSVGYARPILPTQLGGGKHGQAHQTRSLSRGTLWRLSAENGTFILFNSLPIEKRDVDEDDWTVIAPNWKVANADSQKIRVQYNSNLGVVTSLQGSR